MMEKLEKIFGMSKAEIYEALGILPEEFRRDFITEKRKIQKTNNTLWISIPKEYCQQMGLEVGGKIIFCWRKNTDIKNPLILKYIGKV